MGQKTRSFFGDSGSEAIFKKEIIDLKIENQNLLSKMASLKKQEEENKMLKEALNINLSEDFDLIFSSIIGKTLDKDIIIIDRGENQGVLKNMPVITGGKALVGLVGKTYNNFSEIILISSKESALEAKILDNELSALVQGKEGGILYLEMIPPDKNINKDDVVITSGLGGILPYGLLVGKIKEINKSDVDFFQSAEITPFFEIEKLNNLFLINKPLLINEY